MSTTTPPSRHAVPFSERSRRTQVGLAGVLPAVLGVVAGILLGVSEVAYLIVGLLAAVGSFVAGFEHPTAWSAADRGFIAGFIYGGALLLAHAVAGTHATVALGSFPPALALVTALVSMFLCAAGATRD